MGSAASIQQLIPDTITEKEFEALALSNKLFDTQAEVSQFVAANISSWPITRDAGLDLYLNLIRKKAQRVPPDVYFGKELQQALSTCVQTVVHDALEKAQPDERILPVAFAEVINCLCTALYNAAEQVCDTYATNKLGFDSKQLHDFHHTQIAVDTEVVVTSPPIIQSTVT